MDSTSTAKESDLNPPEKSKILAIFYGNISTFISFHFISYLLSGTLWSESVQISVKGQYFLIICVESNLTFYRKKN